MADTRTPDVLMAEFSRVQKAFTQATRGLPLADYKLVMEAEALMARIVDKLAVDLEQAVAREQANG